MDITPFDLRRMFLGDLPPLFLLEIVFRTAFLFLYTLLMIRVVGKRGLSQLTPFELTIIIALGSAVGDPMFYPDVPLLHGMVVITVVVALQRNLIYLVHRSDRVESFVEGEPAQMVVDGRLELKCMEHERFSRDELFSSLRLERVEHLGQVKCAYLEDSGQLSAFLFTPRETRPGLPIIPPWELAEPQSFASGTAAPETAVFACNTCGNTLAARQGQTLPTCSYCEGEAWVTAVGNNGEE
jgi:uncharacterized membrane protein YcaP (DUF421 family)